MAFKRSEWNDIIDQVNEVLQNPPPDTDCDPLPTIDNVGPVHRWSKADITEVQEALKGTCEDISFDTIPELWKQSIIDAINNALGQAWCDCQPNDDDCDEESAKAEDGTEFLIYDNGPPKVVSNCYGNELDDLFLRDLIDDMQVGEDGISGRVFKVERRNIRNDGVITVSNIASGRVKCTGKIEYSGNAKVAQVSGIGVHCFSCVDDLGCVTALADAADQLSGPSIFYNQYVLSVQASTAECAECCPRPKTYDWDNDGSGHFVGEVEDLVSFSFNRDCTGAYEWQLKDGDDQIVFTFNGTVFEGEIFMPHAPIAFDYDPAGGPFEVHEKVDRV